MLWSLGVFNQNIPIWMSEHLGVFSLWCFEEKDEKSYAVLYGFLWYGWGSLENATALFDHKCRSLKYRSSYMFKIVKKEDVVNMSLKDRIKSVK